jgi:hypothetical protein
MQFLLHFAFGIYHTTRIQRNDQYSCTNGHRSTEPISDEESPSSVDKYDPSIYRCTGYNTEGYVWFDGDSKAEDRRFVIDLKDGSMDK